MLKPIEIPREIWVYEFTEKSAHEFREQVMMMAEDEGPSGVIPINIDSYGGSVYALAKMIETMNEMPNQFLTRVSGKAMSCGAILASQGDVRFIGDLSNTMVHNVSAGVMGDVTDMESVTENVKEINKQMMGLLAKNCGMSYASLQSKIKASTNSKEIWLNAEQSVEFGLADFVGTPKLVPRMQIQLVHTPIKKRGEGIDLEDFVDPERAKKKAKAKKKPTKKKK